MAVITRTISVTADAVVLGLTLWKTIYIFREREEVRAGSKLTTRLAYGGNIVNIDDFILVTDIIVDRLYAIWVGLNILKHSEG